MASLVCANPRTGACLQGGELDDDCCPSEGEQYRDREGSCAPGYIYAGQRLLWETATTHQEGFHVWDAYALGVQRTCTGREYARNTCCVPM